MNRGKTSAVLSNAEWLQILADCATIEAKVAKPIGSFAEYALRKLRGIYPQAQSPVRIKTKDQLRRLPVIYKRFKLRKKDLLRYEIFHIFAKINSPYAKMGGYFTIPDP